MLNILGLRPRPLPDQLKLKLPQVNSFVELTMALNGPRGSVCVESLNDRSLTVGALPRMSAGGNGVFIYENAVGKFRFVSKCVAVRDGIATFAIPDRIEALAVFANVQQRNAARLEVAITAHWRFAPGARGSGDFTRASLTDISRTGASLTVDREIKRGTYLETCFAIGQAPPLVLIGEVMRSSVIESSKKIALGLRFNAVKPEEERAITEFITKRQAERRSRGLA
jgi:hypothetical protein